MERIVFLDKSGYPEYLDLTPPDIPHTFTVYENTYPDQVVSRLEDATIAIVNKVLLFKKNLSKLNHLKMIASTATGVNNIDLEYCKNNGIIVCNVKGYGNRSVAEHTLMLTLCLFRQLTNYQQSLFSGIWQEREQFCYFHDNPIQQLEGASVGIIGSGSLGSSYGELCSLLGAKVYYALRKNDSSSEPKTVNEKTFKPFNQIITESDVISIHVPLLPETKHLISKDEIFKMKPTAVLINVARGGIVDESAIYDALMAKKIFGAGFDVLSKEPPDSTSLLYKLARHSPNFILTPHVAWGSLTSLKTNWAKVKKNIESFVQGKPINRVA